jgi:hypothetical protein
MINSVARSIDEQAHRFGHFVEEHVNNFYGRESRSEQLGELPLKLTLLLVSRCHRLQYAFFQHNGPPERPVLHDRLS